MSADVRSRYLSSYDPPQRRRDARWFVYAGTVDAGFLTMTLGPIFEWAPREMNGLPLVWAGCHEPGKAELVKLGIEELDEPYEVW